MTCVLQISDFHFGATLSTRRNSFFSDSEVSLGYPELCLFSEDQRHFINVWFYVTLQEKWEAGVEGMWHEAVETSFQKVSVIFLKIQQ